MSALSLLRRQGLAAMNMVRGGGGAPYPGHRYKEPTKPLPYDFDRIWNDGTGNPEHVLDIYAPHFSTATCAMYFAGGLSVFYGVWLYVNAVDKPSMQPFAPRENMDPEY